ncbi:segregation and condensation protein A [Thermovenabulum sp.]|uniref:segregation and condensation protein A n=1 Tax=Thermovenabulum sp. TaxID=3100335 RepID=UPI003C7A8A23
MISVKLEAFEGPLDLLLHLIEKNKINIYDIPISEITEQYISYLYNLENMDIEIASQFLLMASTLLSIKSKMLLPQSRKSNDSQMEIFSAIDEDPRAELVERLLEYRKYKEIASLLREREEKEMLLIKKKPEDFSNFWEDEFILPKITLKDIINIYYSLMKESKNNKDFEIKLELKDSIPLKQKIKNVYKQILKKKKATFADLFNKTCTRMEIIVTFLAVLELYKLNKIDIIQEKPFDDIYIFLKIRGENRWTENLLWQ